MSALFSLLLESGAILGFLLESHILLWQTGQLITVIIVSPFVSVMFTTLRTQSVKYNGGTSPTVFGVAYSI